MKNKIFTSILIFAVSAVASCRQPETKVKKEINYQAQGDSIIKATFDTLKSALTKAIQREGLPGAVKYCNENAFPITAVWTSENITLKRVAENYRNPKNAPDSTDSVQWKIFTTAKAKGDALQPSIVEAQNVIHYYKPILLQPMCSACHGKKGVDILPAVSTIIDSLYPNDKATGFSAGDLRGMWRVSFIQR